MKSRIQLLILTVMTITLFNNCVMRGVDSVSPSKNSITKVYDTEAFDAIQTGVVGDIIYTQSDTSCVRVYAPDNIMPYIEVNVKHNTLFVTMNKKIKLSKKCDLKVMVSCPEITKITSTGVGNFKLDGKVKAGKLTIDLEGVGNIVADDLDCTDLRINSSGVGDMKLKGKTVEVKYKSTGVGYIKAYELTADHVQAEASGVGSIQCNASKAIKAELSGVGSIKFKGNPQTKNFSRNGVGKIRQVD